MAKDKPDSVTHHEERHAKMQQEAAAQHRSDEEAEEKRELTQAERDRKTREAENQELAQYAGLVKENETREMLLDRIRKMRENPPKEPDPPTFRSDGLQKEFDAEQEAGRKAVAAAEQEQERNRELWRKHEAEERKRQGEMNPVHHPNPSQDDQYPASQATLGKRK
jgi:hypothetical protein